MVANRSRGNLATKSLAPIVNPSLLVTDSEYLETHLIAVPNTVKKDFLKEYETLSPMVVPRSSVDIDHDDEFTLFGVTTFKKHSAEFLQKCREKKWTPRQFKYVEGGREEEQRELDRITNEERKVCGEALRMGRTGWSESVMVWMHVLTLRVFVEAVLRYGLPLEYLSVLVKVCSEDYPFDHLRRRMLTRNRRQRSSRIRSRLRWTVNSRSLAAMPLGVTSVGG